MFNNYEIVEYTQPSIPDPELHRPDHTGRPGRYQRRSGTLASGDERCRMPETTTWKSYSHGSIRFVDSVNMKTGRTYEKTKVFSYVLLSYHSIQEINRVPTY